MNFNVMGFVIGREMAKRELGSGKEDRANQLGLIGAMTPDPMMGAMYSMMIARNEGPSASSASTTSDKLTSPKPTPVSRVQILDDKRQLEDGDRLMLGTVAKGGAAP